MIYSGPISEKKIDCDIGNVFVQLRTVCLYNLMQGQIFVELYFCQFVRKFVMVSLISTRFEQLLEESY